MTEKEKQMLNKDLHTISLDELHDLTKYFEPKYEDAKQKSNAAYNNFELNIKSIAEAIERKLSKYVDSKTIKMTVTYDGDFRIPTSYDGNMFKGCHYKLTFRVGFKRTTYENNWNEEDLSLEVTDLFIRQSGLGCNRYSRQSSPCMVAAIKIANECWEHEEEIKALVAEKLSMTRYNKYRECANARYDYMRVVEALNRENEKRKEAMENEAFIKLLKTSKYYVFDNKSKEHEYHYTRFFRITKVTDKNVKMTEIGLSSYHEASDFEYVSSYHTFKLEGDVLTEMRNGVGFTADNIDSYKEKYREACEARKAEKAATSDAQA